MGFSSKEHRNKEPELQWKPRRWSEHWFSCFGDCTGSGWQGCCLAYWVPCVAFGCNSRKVLGKSFWLEALKYVVILGLASLVYRAVRVSEFITCDVAASETLDNPAATESEKREATEAYLMCKFKFIGFELVLLAAVLLSAVYWAVFVGGPRRRQIRETLGIPVTDTRGACCSSCHNHGDYCNSDCCLHYWCTCCALAQETRTVLEAEREEREVRLTMPAGYTPLMAAPSSGADMERHTTTAGEKLMPILV